MTPSGKLIQAVGALFAVGLFMGVLDALGHALPDVISAAWWGLLLCLALFATLDGRALRRLPSPTARRTLPTNLALGRWHDVQVELGTPTDAPLLLDVFDHVPSAFLCQSLPQQVSLLPGQHGRIVYQLCPQRRGAHRFDACEVRLYSRWRFWRQRRALALVSETRVYPDFTRLHGAPLMAVDSWLNRLGIRQQPRRGLGLDFHQLREFREGDTTRQIDWKATARKRTPIVREYQDERDQQLLLLLDCGRRMRSQDDALSHFDHALNATLLLSYVALRQGDAIGCQAFATPQERFIAPAKGQAQLTTLLNGVYDLENSQLPADYEQAAAALLRRQKRRALVVIISNLRDEDDENLLGAVRQLSRRHRVLVVSLREKVLDELRQYPVEGFAEALDYGGAIAYLDARDRLHERLAAQGIPVLDARPEELGPALISRYLAWKKGGVL